jgi:hypothetical protein
MLVILMENQLLRPETVCKSCPMASQNGLPRWQEGRLKCGRLVTQVTKPVSQGPAQYECATQYECAMGFRIAELSDQSS